MHHLFTHLFILSFTHLVLTDILHKHLKISRGDNCTLTKIRSFSTASLAKHYPALVKVVRGGKDKHLQGTWVHEKIALKFAAWLSPAFELWVYDRVYELITEGVTLPYSKKELEWYLTKIMDNAQDTQNLIDSLSSKGLDVNRKELPPAK